MNPESKVPDGTDVMAVLIRSGGRRETPPESAYRTVLAAAQSALQDKLRRRRGRRLAWTMAAAAAAGLAGVMLYQWALPTAPAVAVQVAGIDLLDGRVEIRDPDATSWRGAASSRVLTQGSRLRTGPDAGAGLLLQQQLSLRVAADTEIELTDPARVQLLRGALYVDARPDGADRLVVGTPLGTARHEGTQFELRYEPQRLRLSVREGRVYLDGEAGAVEVAAGESLLVTGAGRIERTRVPADDTAWQWTQPLAPVPDFDARPARDLLEWAARETGRSVHYRSAAAERHAASVVLHGRLPHLPPVEALRLALATTDLEADLEQDRILVGTR